jgi:molybdopterin-binding protein
VSDNSPTTGAVLEAKDLTVFLGGRKIVEVPSLQVLANEVLVLIGPNGSGKTTLVMALAHLVRPTSGTVLVEGKPSLTGADMLKTRRRFAVVFQEPLLLDASVWSNVTLGPRLRGNTPQDLDERAQKWLDRFGVGHLARRNARTLSGGEAKRVSLARAFVLDPQILFLDEPFNALDSPTRQSLLEDFESVIRETKVTTVMVTHERSEALALGHRVAVMMGGRVRQIGTSEEVFSSPVDEAVAAFVEAGNIMRGMIVAQNGGLATVGIAGRELQAVSELPQGTYVSCYLHFEDVTLALPSPGSPISSARNQIAGRVAKAFPFGAQLKVTCDCGFVLSSVITRRSWDEMGLHIGSDIVVTFKASALHLIPRID